MFIISTLAHKFQCHFVHSPSSKIVVAIVAINMLVLSHGRGFFCLHVQRLHHIWQCWCCSVGSDLQKWRSTFSWCQYIKPSHLWSFLLPSGDHGSRGLWLAAGGQKTKGFEACRVVQLLRNVLVSLIRRKKLLTTLQILSLLKESNLLHIFLSDPSQHLLHHGHSVRLLAHQEEGRLHAADHQENIGHIDRFRVSLLKQSIYEDNSVHQTCPTKVYGRANW